MGGCLAAGMKDYDGVAAQGMIMLQESGFRPDYVAIRRAEDLRQLQDGDTRAVILAAAWLGSTRLIDNLSVTLKERA